MKKGQFSTATLVRARRAYLKKRKKTNVAPVVRVAPRHDLITMLQTSQQERDSGIQFDPLTSYARIGGPPQGIAGKWPKHKGGGNVPWNPK